MSSQIFPGFVPIYGEPLEIDVSYQPDGSVVIGLNPAAIGSGSGDMLKVVYDLNNDGIVDAASSVPWTGVTDPPATYPPSPHNHDDRYYTETEVDTLIANAGASSHNHDDRYYTETEVDSLLTTHNHDSRYYTESEVDSLLTAHNHDSRYYTETETDALLAGYSQVGHDHDNRYYTEAETNALLTGYSPVAHEHDNRYYTEAEIGTILNGYSQVGHSHNDLYYTEAETNAILAGYSPATHDHDNRYYTEIEIGSILNGYSQVGHDHDNRYYTEAETNALLAGYSPTTHDHDSRYYTEGEVDSLLTTHNHDSRYYTEGEVDSLLTTHNHDSRYYTETETNALLTGYSPTTHTHTSFSSLTKAGFAKSDSPSLPATGVVNLFIDVGGNLCWQNETGQIGRVVAVDGSTLTVPATGTAALKATVQTPGRVAYWMDSNTVTDDSGLTYDAASDRLTVSGGVTTPIIRPAADSTTAVRIQNNGGSKNVMTVDTTNKRVGVGSENPQAPGYVLDVYSVEPDFAAKIRNVYGDAPGNGLWVDTRWNVPSNLPLKVSSNQGANILFLVTGNGNIGANVPSLDLSSGFAGVDVGGNVLRLRSSRTISSSSATGNTGEICWDANYIYVCVAQNVWKRAALSSW